MPSRPINQQTTSGPDDELQSAVCTAEQVIRCQASFIDESYAISREKGAARTFTNLFHPGNHLFEKGSSGRQGPTGKTKTTCSLKLFAKSCHRTDTQPSKDSPSASLHSPASYSHSLLHAMNYYPPLLYITKLCLIHLQLKWLLM